MNDEDDQEFGPGISGDERRELRAVARRLESERPTPAPAFRGELRRGLEARLERGPNLPMLRGLAYLCAASGTALFIVALIGVAGSGPLAAG
jgi:hypothetical protein